jgi:hypothetical protein
VRIEILSEAQEDLIAGFRFYEHQALSLGSYFRESILSDVDALVVVGGVTPKFSDITAPSVNAFPLRFIIA